ncbi:MAG: MBL fold metallo-hydrolase [Deltaproteobacteria bacterium]|nr:MBL fold metallo-hydrolase [Deltaproteobacteria bacterium]
MTRLNQFDLTFLGAAQTVTGSMYLLEVDDYKIIVDCGFFQGRRQESATLNRNIPKTARDADAMILTHAHIDHSGNIPGLVKSGFQGQIHCTATTADLCGHMLRDSARIQEHDAAWLNRKNNDDPDWKPIEPLYTEDDAIAALEKFVPHAYDTPFELNPRIKVHLVDAGHVLGSASVIIDVLVNGHSRRVVFSGDIGRRNLPILKDPVPPSHPDFVIMETTYGNREHGPVASMHEQLAKAIEETRQRGGKVIIPSFALERTQEILFALNELCSSGRIKPIPVYLDSPLAINLTEVFRKHRECFDEEAATFSNAHGDPFGFDMLRVVESAKESMALNELSEPAIIISASGMCEGGRIVHHLRNNIENHKNAVVIVGYQAQHTLGRRIVERRRQVPIFGVKRDLNARVYVLNAFSAHADKNELLWWARECGSQVRKFFLVHGDPEQSVAFAEQLDALGMKSEIPRRGTKVSLLDS